MSKELNINLFSITSYAHRCLLPPTASWSADLLYSSLFFSGAWSCYRQDKTGLPELQLSIIPLPSSEKKSLELINTQLQKSRGSDGERRQEQRGVERGQKGGREGEFRGSGTGNMVRLLPCISNISPCMKDAQSNVCSGSDIGEKRRNSSAFSMIRV